MSVRTCLLCGKPLSRIWVGTGEDFCSREHRNQYRMRRGMDRLLEANKISNVMRRRELPKPVAQPVPLRGGGPRWAESPGTRIAADTPAPIPRVRRPKPATFALQVRDPLPDRHICDYSAEQRGFQILRQQKLRVLHFARKARIAPTRATTPDESIRNARLAPAPQKGRALRVSLSIGFRLPVLVKRRHTSRFSGAAKLANRKPAVLPPLKEMAGQKRTFNIELSISGAPRKPRLAFTLPVNFRWPGPRPLFLQPEGGAPERRETAPVRGHDLPPPDEVRLSISIHAASLISRFVRLPSLPVDLPAARMSSSAPFAPQDLPAPLPIQEHQIQ